MSFPDDAAITATALEAHASQALARDGRVIRQPRLAELSRQLAIDTLIREGGLHGERLADFLNVYLSASTRLQHPAYMAHQVAVPMPLSAIAAMIDSHTNNAMAIYEMGPAAATVEFAIVNWMLAKTGWRPSPAPDVTDAGEGHGGGTLTHGGSLANLTALLAARARIAPTAWETGTPHDLVIVTAPGSHYSIARAAAIMGLGQNAIRHAPSDAEGRIDATRLPRFIAGLRSQGMRPMCVVAAACGTALGLYDPIAEIAAVCRDNDIWLHVDGAHGASALLSPRLRSLLDGLEFADSLVWDAHKMLRTSTLCAAVLVRDHRHLDQTFREDASYLFHDKDQPGFDFIHRTVECTKSALGLKILFALADEGETAIARYIERQSDLATEAAALLRAQSGIEVATEPQSNIVCFRFQGRDDVQIALRRRLTQDGDFYISSTEAMGKRWLRLALMNPATTIDDIAALLARLRQFR